MTDAKTLIRETPARAVEPRTMGAVPRRRLPIGAEPLREEGVDFRLWAPSCREIALEIEAELKIDPNRRYVTGLSSGAGMSVALAVAHSDYFAAAGSVEGMFFSTNWVKEEGAETPGGSLILKPL